MSREFRDFVMRGGLDVKAQDDIETKRKGGMIRIGGRSGSGPSWSKTRSARIRLGDRSHSAKKRRRYSRLSRIGQYLASRAQGAMGGSTQSGRFVRAGRYDRSF